MIQVFLAEQAGFCGGVRNAIDLTLEEASKGKEVYTLGPLVHNERVGEYLQSRGIQVVEEADSLEAGAVVIRTHGATPAFLNRLQERAQLEVIDATCPYVKRVQEIAHNFSSKGYGVFIYGDRGHPEVQALLGWAGENARVIEPSREGLLEKGGLPSRAVLISQTTQREKEFLGVAEELKKLCPELKVFKTICRATILRQEAAAKLAATVDLMLVVGDHKSSNTRKLAQVCREITRTYQITGPEVILPEWLVGVGRVGVTAGASTPDWTIKEVMAKMENNELEARSSETFSYQEEEVKEYRPGDVVTGKVVAVEDEQVMVDIGYKTEAFLPIEEVLLPEGTSLQDQFSADDEVDLLVVKVNEEEDKVIVSKKRLERERRWRELDEAHDAAENMTGVVKEVVPAGIIIDLGTGIEGFMPGSLVDTRYIPDFQQFVGQELTFKVIELSRERDKVILSRKQTLEEEAEEKKGETLQNLQEDEIIKGVVKRLTNFGAFVDVGGIDGLVHISEISWQRIGHPQDVLNVGDEVDVKVLEVIPERERISLSLRQAQPDPWSKVDEEIDVGEVINGRVTRIVNFGAFVELIPGVEGLVHISQMADFHVKHPSEIVEEGEEIEAKVLDVNTRDKRISLSIKEASPAPRDFSSHSTQKEEESQNVTLGDVFGDLFNESMNKEEDEEE